MHKVNSTKMCKYDIITKLPVLLFFSFISNQLAVVDGRPTRFIDNGTSLMFPGCSANYNAPCSFNIAYRLVETIVEDFPNYGNDSQLLDEVNNGAYNPHDTRSFAPFVFNASNMQCIANGRNTTFIGLTLEEIADALDVPIVQTNLSARLYSASDSDHDGWVTFSFTSEDYPDDPVTHLGYVNQVNSTDNNEIYVILAMFAQRTSTRVESDSCPTTVNRRCSIENAISLVGNMLARAMMTETPKQLVNLWQESSFPLDTYLREGNWYIFGTGFGENFPHYFFTHIRTDWIGKTLYEISELFVSPSIQNGTLIHEQFVDAALQGGAWVDYSWTTSTVAAIGHKVSYVAGAKLFGNQYYFGVGFDHKRDAAVSSALCQTCSTNYSEPCSIGNALAISAHAEVELLANNAINKTFYDLSTSEEFSAAGGFGVLIVDYDNMTVMADSLDSSLRGSNVEAAFLARHITQTDTSHNTLIEMADGGGGWARLPSEDGFGDFVAMVSRVSEYDHDYYIMTGYIDAIAPTETECSAEFDAGCSASSARALVGHLVTAINTCESDEELDAIFSNVNRGPTSNYTVSPNFYAIVLDDDYYMRAVGDPDLRGSWNISTEVSFLTYMREEHSITSLGEDFLSDLQTTSFEQGGGFISVEWNEAGGTSKNVTFFSLVAQHYDDYGERKNFFVASIFTNADAPTLCSDGCPESSYCVDDDDSLPRRCACGFYYVAEYEEENSTCATTPTTDVTMSCTMDPDKSSVKSVKAIARALGIINCLFALFCISWTVLRRNHIIVKASQPMLLILVGLGTIVSSMTIFVMTIDDFVGPPAGDGENTRANLACMAQPWFYGVGFAITYCSMIVKLERVAKVFRNAALMKKTRGVSMRATVASLVGLLSIEVLVLLLWTFIDPLYFGRPDDNPLNGACKSPASQAFVIVLAMYHLMLLLHGARLSYRCRKVNGVFAETKYLSLAMIGNLQVLLLALPVIVLTADDTATSMFIRSIAVFINDFSTTALIFCPKIYFSIFGPPESSGAGTSALVKTKGSNNKSGGNSKVESIVSTVRTEKSSFNY